jgi:hypothetical protein
MNKEGVMGLRRWKGTERYRRGARSCQQVGEYEIKHANWSWDVSEKQAKNAHEHSRTGDADKRCMHRRFTRIWRKHRSLDAQYVDFYTYLHVLIANVASLSRQHRTS